VNSTSNIGSVQVGGDLHSGAVAAAGQIKTVRILGKLNGDDPAQPAVVAALAQVGSTKPKGAVGVDTLLVRQDVENAQILLGFKQDQAEEGVRYLPRNADASAGKVVVRGDWTASSLVAGVFDATGDGFGQNDQPITGDTTQNIVARIATVVIKGNASGSVAGGDSYAITAQEIGKLTIAGDKIALTAGKDNLLLDAANGDFRLVEI
jgi:hypothetical protein